LLQIRAALGEFPQHRLGRLARFFQRWILRHIHRIPHAACVSTKTRHDLLRLTPSLEARSSVVLNDLNYPYQRRSREDAERILNARALAMPAAGGFLLNIGSGSWYKNRAGLIEIYAQLRIHLPSPPALVIVGSPLDAALHARVVSLGLEAYVHVFSHLDEAALEALYALAEGLIFPSWAEGFGWPIAEAQACGCPVFTSNRAPMTEVGGDAAVYFDPADPARAAATIAAAWPRRDALRAAGLVHATTWSSERMLDTYEALYAQLRQNG
jgi:glycosyltransferase involved in cell wall biosynthesis